MKRLLRNVRDFMKKKFDALLDIKALLLIVVLSLVFYCEVQYRDPMLVQQCVAGHLSTVERLGVLLL